jgi:large subunit ribosomal protein L18
MSITTKKQRRLRRAVKTRARIRDLGVARLSVHRTPQHIYAQVIDASGAKVLAAASTLQEAVRQGLKGTGNVDAAKAVGRVIAERAKAAGVTKVAFDRAGFQFHGRVKALADAAREAGLEF